MPINSETHFNLRSNFQIKQYNSIHPTTWAKPNQENVTFLNPPSPLPPLTEMSFNSFCKFDKKIARRTNINFLNKSKKQNLPLKFWFWYINIPCFFFLLQQDLFQVCLDSMSKWTANIFRIFLCALDVR